MTDETKKWLLDAIEGCEMIDSGTVGLDLGSFVGVGMLRDGVCCRLLVIGEALNWIRRHDPATAAQIPNLGQMVAMRHRSVHGCAEIDDEIVWDVGVSKLGPLREWLAALLGERSDA